MPPTTSKNKPGSLQRAINPIPFIVVGVVALLVVVYMTMIKPGKDADKAAKEWTTPEAAALRAPGAKPKDASYEKVVEDLRAKRNRPGEGPNRSRRRDD